MTLPDGLNGSCHLAVEIKGRPASMHAGVRLAIEDGKVASCTCRLSGAVEAAVAGAPFDWLRRLHTSDDGRLALSGDTALALEVLNALTAVPRTYKSARPPSAHTLSAGTRRPKPTKT